MRRPGRYLIALLLSFALLTVTAAASGAAETAAPEENQISASETEKQQVAVPEEAVGQGISMEIHHVLLEGRESGSIQVKEVLKVKNSLNETFTGTENIDNNKKAVLRISLPPGYTDLQVEGLNRDSVVANPDGIITTSPLVKGTTDISLFYKIPFDTENSLNFEKKVNYPTDILYVMSPKGQLKLKSDGSIQDYGLQEFEGRSYHVLLLEKAMAEQKFGLTVSADRVGQGYSGAKSGFHSTSHLQRWASSPLSGTDPHLWVAALAILFFAGVAAAGLYLKKKHLRQKELEREEQLAKMLDNLVIRQKRLLDKIAALDHKAETGEADSGEIVGLREQYMKKLLKIKLKIRELEALE